jgi:hypothetical protein
MQPSQGSLLTHSLTNEMYVNGNNCASSLGYFHALGSVTMDVLVLLEI